MATIKQVLGKALQPKDKYYADGLLWPARELRLRSNGRRAGPLESNVNFGVADLGI
jgi:hypothetical protein